jgi:CubicO group peptidase (beta-lactamase class C family)
MEFEKRQVKIGLGASLVMLLVSMLMLKPYLPRALYHNFAKIDDYKFFDNREVKALKPEPWGERDRKFQDPKPATEKLLSDLKTTALLMIENHQIVYEKYAEGGGMDEISGAFSMAKSILGLLTGFALEEGAIRSLNDPVSTWITEWEGSDSGKITVKDLLTMSSGLNWNESYANPFSITTEAYYGSNLLFTTLRQRSIAEPGKKFIYQSGTSQLLGLVLARATNKNLAVYASQKLWTPLGAERDALWSLDHPDGMEKAYCCFNARARDFAKLGEFVLNHGKWNGVQLLSESYLNDMTSAKLTPFYGYQIWLLNTSQGVIPYMRGILGQYILIIPQKNRIIVRLGKKRGNTIDQHPEEVRALAEWGLQ